MTRYRNIPPRSFKNSSWYPGTSGNPLDRILNSGAKIEQIPAFLFTILLAFLACLGGKFNLIFALVLFLFFLADWLLVSLLPKLNLSFGPVKPVVLMLAILRALFSLLPFWWSLGLQITGTILVLYGFYFEPFWLDIHSETLETSKLRSGEHLRVAHLGDLHIEQLTKREQQLLIKLTELDPDLILFSGDVLNLSYVRDPQIQQVAQKFLSSLTAPLGVFGVTGSPPVDPQDVYPKLIAGTELHWLDNSQVKVPFGKSAIWISGITCTHQPENDFSTFQNLKMAVPLSGQNEEDCLNILLYHSPDIAPLMCSTDVDLQLSGHTHGGQVRLPFFGALYAASLYGKTFESGRYQLGRTILYVTRGLGMEGGIAPRVRFLCRPEVIIWNIIGKG